MENIITLFVDNLADRTDNLSLRNKFTDFGIVKDVYIPNKRGKFSGRRFGFVRFDCSVSADIAIAKANGSRFMGKTIVVKLAAFNNLGASKSKDLQNTHRPVSFRGPSHEQVTDSRRFTFRGPSFADVVSRKRSSDNTTIIKAQEEDINWLHRSIVASLNAQRSVDSLRDAFITEGVLDIQIRELGANQVLLTFPSSQDLMAMLEGGDMCWLFNFFAEVKQWTPDIKLENSRVIWLNCYGVPINLWNAGTFFSIGKLWGETITLDEATSKKTSFSVGKIKISTSNFEVINHSLNLEHNGVLFPIRVVEEQVVVQNFMKAVCECKGCGFARVVFSPCSGEKLILEQDKLEGNLVAGDKVHTVEMAKLSKDDVNVDSNNLSTSMVGESLCPLRPEVKAVLVDAYLSDGNNVGFGELNKKDTDGGPLGHGNIGDQDKDDNFAPCKDGSRVIGMVFESAKDTLSKEVSDSITSPLPHEQVFDRKRGLSKPPASFPVAKVTTSSSVSVDSDLVSADPLINYVEYMRHKKKARAKKGFQRKPLWTKNPLKAAIFSRKVSRDQIEKRSKPVKLGLKKDSFDGCSLSTEGEASSDICKRNAILIKEARESMEINASLGVKFFGRESYNIKKFLEIQGVDISEQDIKAFIDLEEGASISVEF